MKPTMVKLVGIAVFLCFVLTIPSACAAPEVESQERTDAILFIYGGLGAHFTIINDSNESIQAYYDIFGEGYFVNKTWHTHGSFTASPNVWTSAPPVFVPFSVMPIAAYLYTDQDDMLVRKGISVFGWVIFTM